jgi:hypothetical protein
VCVCVRVRARARVFLVLFVCGLVLQGGNAARFLH